MKPTENNKFKETKLSLNPLLHTKKNYVHEWSQMPFSSASLPPQILCKILLSHHRKFLLSFPITSFLRTHSSELTNCEGISFLHLEIYFFSLKTSLFTFFSFFHLLPPSSYTFSVVTNYWCLHTPE